VLGTAAACDRAWPTDPVRDADRPTAAAAATDDDARLAAAEVVVSRSSVLPAQGGAARRRVNRTWVASPGATAGAAGVPTLVPTGVAAGAAAGQPAAQDSLVALLARAAVPVVRIAAPTAAATCVDARPWTRRVAGAAPGTHVTLTGVEGAPPTTVTIDGPAGPVATVAFTWVRRPRSWELVRQETSTPADGVVDVVTVERRHGGRAVAVRALPAAICAGAASGRVSLAGGLSGGVFGGSTRSVTGIDQCSAALASDGCNEKRRIVATQMAEYVAVATTGYMACFYTPPPVNYIACTSAFAAIAARAVAVRNALADLRECEAAATEQKRIACGCAVTSRGEAEAPVFSRAAAPVELSPAGAGAVPSAAPTRNGGSYCESPPASGTEHPADFFTYPTPGGGGFDPGQGSARVCVYTDYYAADGTYLYSVNHGCFQVTQ
jgi:hypothetical protein